MAMKAKLCLAIFLLSLLALCSNIATAKKEKEVEHLELKTCQDQCKQQQQYSEDDKKICMKRCEEYAKIMREREKKIEEEIRKRKEQEEEEEGKDHHHHPEEKEEEQKEEEGEDLKLKTCQHQCKQQLKYSEDDKKICMRRCEEEYAKIMREREKKIKEEIRKRKEQEEKGKDHHHEEKEEEQEEEEEEQEGEENPYVFEGEDFDTRVETEDGRISLLENFAKKSKLLRGIENYRLAILKANAHAFLPPRHFDSEAIFFNVKGIHN